ncbi:MAG: guanylate kinase [Eubacteriales bacterium]
MKKENLLIVVAGPSGVGKGTIGQRLFKQMRNIEYSVSATTRAARDGEKEGINYFFVSHDKFDEMILKNEFLEYAHVFDNKYGTPKKYVMDQMKSGKDVLLEIDVQGAVMVMESYPDAVFIFILPPSIDELEKRLKGRGTEDKKQMELRLSKAKDEIKYAEKFDYIVVNNSVETAADEMRSIIISEKCKKARNTKIIESLIK